MPIELARGSRGFRRHVPNLRRAAWALGLILCAACAPALSATGKCKLAKFAEFPVTMDQLSPEIVAKINGTDVRLIVDSGAFYSSLDAGSAASLGLRLSATPAWFYMTGVGGRTDASIANVKDFTISGATLHNLEFLVGGSHTTGQAVGLLGRNILQLGDSEYDFAGGVARLMKAEDCSDAVLAYWVRAGDSYSVIDMVKPEKVPVTGSHVLAAQVWKPAVVAVVYVNGVPISAMFDTGASTSFLTLKGAAKAGIKAGSPGVVSAGETRGIGQHTVQTYIAPVAVFKIGDEEIRNTRLRLADTDPGEEMLIGADFFLSHHIYVANSQNKLYFTYNGGPVFNLATQQAAASAPSSPAAEAPPPAASADAKQPAENSKQPVEDAAEYARRGAAFRARQELDQALQAFDRACELAPDNADYLYQRALLYAQMKQSGPAAANLDRTIQLDPHHVAALLMRAGYRTQSGDKMGAETDLDAANAVLPKEDNERLTLASEYSNIDLFQRAIEQYDLWSASHPQDVRLPLAFEGRCRARALGDLDLQRAMEDCNAALRRSERNSPLYAQVSATRGLLLLRAGDYDKSIVEYEASLKIDPKNAYALYGRGIDELRKQKAPEGQADIAQATALSPKVAENFSRYGILP